MFLPSINSVSGMREVQLTRESWVVSSHLTPSGPRLSKYFVVTFFGSLNSAVVIYLHWKKGWFLNTDLLLCSRFSFMWETVISGVQLNCFIVQCKTPDELLDVFKILFTTWVYPHWLAFRFTIPYIFVIFFVFKGNIKLTLSVQSRKVPSHFRIKS